MGKTDLIDIEELLTAAGVGMGFLLMYPFKVNISSQLTFLQDKRSGSISDEISIQIFKKGPHSAG